MTYNEHGMTHGGQKRLERLVTDFGYRAVGKVSTRYGDIFVAEKINPEGWSVVWGSRDMVQEIQCTPESSLRARQMAAVDAAQRQQRVFESVPDA